MFRQIVRTGKFVIQKTGSLGLARRRLNGPLILMYHGVEPREVLVNRRIQTSHIATDEFIAHLEFLGRHFKVVPIESLGAMGSSGSRTVALTFDDGFTNFKTVVAPILETYGFPAATFVTTGLVETRGRHIAYLVRAALWHCDPGEVELQSLKLHLNLTEGNRVGVIQMVWAILLKSPQELVDEARQECLELLPEDQWRSFDQTYGSEAVMSWNDLEQVKARGFTIGSHTVNHAIFHREQGRKVIAAEVNQSVSEIQEHLGDCRYFAYPNGGVTDVAREAVSDAGIEMAFTTFRGLVAADQDELLVPRFGAPAEMPIFEWYVSTAWRHKKRYWREIAAALSA